MTRLPFRRVVLAGSLVLAVLGIGTATVAVLHPRAVVERVATYALTRNVELAELQIGWGETISVRLRDLKIANSPDAGPAAMVTLAALDAQIDRAALLSGRLVYRKLVIDRPVVVLARDAQGRGNWRFGSGDAGGGIGLLPAGLALIPENRSQFPDLIDFSLRNGEVRYRTGSGRWLVVALDDLRIRGDGAAVPVHLDLAGSYQGVAARLAVVAASFDELRDASRPFPVKLNLVAPRLRLAFEGTMEEPLDLEGALGRLSLDAQRLGALQSAFSAPDTIGAPLRISGDFSRRGDDWRLADARGELAGNGFVARHLHMREGPRGGSDTFDLDLAFAEMDLQPLLAEMDPQGGSLRPDAAPDAPRIDLRLAVASLRHRATSILKNGLLRGTARPGVLEVLEGTGRLGGGMLAAEGSLRAVGARDGMLKVRARLAGAAVEQLSAMVAQSADANTPLHGLVHASVELSMTGATFDAALRHADGSLAVAMRGGTVDRALIEAASSDLRALLRQPGDTMELVCLFGVATLADGKGSIGPLRLHAAGGRFAAVGDFDPVQRSVDLLVRPDRASTGFLALDIPMRVRGSLGNLTVLPAPGAPLPLSVDPKSLPDFARDNPCRP